MNPWMLHAMADSRCREIRHDAAQHAAGAQDNGRARRLASPMTPTAHRLPRMRRQLGYALVEAGLHLLTTAGPAQRGRPGAARLR
jgi:hypothetical protein